MVGLVILSHILSQRFYFVLIMSTPKNVIRKSSLNQSYSVVPVWYCILYDYKLYIIIYVLRFDGISLGAVKIHPPTNQQMLYPLVQPVQAKKGIVSHLEWENIKIWHWQGIHRPNLSTFILHIAVCGPYSKTTGCDDYTSSSAKTEESFQTDVLSLFFEL